MKSITPALFALCAGTAYATAPAPGAQWKKTQFLDDFNGASGRPPNAANWMIRTGTSDPGGQPNWGTGEIETYTSASKNVKQAGNGNLWITPINTNGQWTSGRIETRNSNFSAPAGGKMRVEARIKSPAVNGQNGLGYWPAFWMLGQNFRGNYNNWPSVGEIDILEAVNGVAQSTSVLHCDVAPGGACNEPSGLAVAGSCSGSVCPGNFHIYEAVLDRSVQPEVLRFFLDRVLVHQITETQVGSTIWEQTMHHGFFIILNVAMGGAYPNAVAGVTTPTSATISGAQMAVDYVAVWSTS